MTDAEKNLRAQNLRRIDHVGIGAIGDVISTALEPVAKREFPQQKLPRADGKWMIEDLCVLAVRTIEARRDIWCPGVSRVGIHRIVIRPSIVGLPGIVAALKQNVCTPPVPHDENDIALPGMNVGTFSESRKAPQIH